MKSVPSLFKLIIAVGIWVSLILGCNAGRPSKPPPKLTFEQIDAINKALDAKGYPYPVLEIADTGFLVATFQLDAPPRNKTLRAFAEDAVIIIRNAMHSQGIFNKYRVVVNGNSPGPGLIRRYGVARYIEGDQVSWEPAN